MKLIDSPFEISSESSINPVLPGMEIQLNETDRQRWIWAFERLKNADIGLSFSEKAKIFCEASTPEEVEGFIEARLQDHSIIPLAA